MKTTTHRPISKAIHKWAGLPISILMLVFCVSGVILNHRSLFTTYSVSRSLLPSEYHIENYNNGIIKGTLRTGNGKVLAFGNSGVWLTDTRFSSFADFNTGLPEGIDRRNIRDVTATKDGTLWCATQFGVYRHNGAHWQEMELPECRERVADITLTGDSTSVVALTRTAVYPLTNSVFRRQELKAPSGYEKNVSMYKTLWMLHSGELFGLPGRLIVDSIAVILAFLSITGIALFILPYSLRTTIRTNLKARLGRTFKWNFRWHDRIGYVTIILTIIVAFTGMCLRPPLMIPFVTLKTAPLPATALNADNAWHDKLRAIRWDRANSRWLLSTSEGFFTLDSTLESIPVKVQKKNVPPVSPMGVTVFEPRSEGRWLIGSFSGMFVWNPADDTLKDFFTGKDYEKPKSMRPISDHLVTGYSKDIAGRETVFDYSEGADIALPKSEEIERQPMSLWNFALELHVGRCYTPLIGPFSSLFVFLAGAITITVLLTGLALHRRHRPHKQKPTQ